MPSKVDIWMPLSIGDYLADTGHLTTTQHGAYLLLLMHYWRRGPLPNNIEQVASICKLQQDAWSIAQALLDEFFELQEDGKYHQGRADRELEKWQGKRLKAQEKARSAAETRWKKDSPSNAPSNAPSNQQAMLGLCPLPSPLPLPLPTPKNQSPSAHREASSREKEIIESIFSFYCEKLQKNPKKYQLTDERRKKASLRFKERLKANEGNEAAVETELSQAVENLAASEYHITKGYTDWIEQIFRSQEEFEKRLNWKPGGKSNGRTNGSAESVSDRIQRSRAQTPENPLGGGDAPRGAGEAGEPARGRVVGEGTSSLF